MSSSSDSDAQSPTILFVASSLNAAPYRKRVEAFRRVGCRTRAVATSRRLPYPSDELATDTEVLTGGFSQGYSGRVLHLLTRFASVRRRVREADYVCAFGLDVAAVVALALITLRRPPRFLYEVHDIRPLLTGTTLASAAARRVDRWVTRSADLLVVTSDAYVTEYFHRSLGCSDCVSRTVENKVHAWDVDPGRKARSDGPSDDLPKLGYFGSIRCPRSWSAVKAIARSGCASVLVRGVATESVPTFHVDCSVIDSIEFAGPYEDPGDLPDLYEAVDLVWAAGYHGKLSYLWSRSCRFYYAGYFRKPIIAQRGTVEAGVVEELGIGIVVDVSDPEGVVEAIRSISAEKRRTWERNMAQLPEHTFEHTTDYPLRLLEAAAGIGRT